MAKNLSVSELVEDFVQKLTNVLQQDTETRAREAVLSAFGGSPRGPRASSRTVPKVKKESSPRLKLAGRYMGLIRRMKKGEQKQIKSVRATQGIEAAIELMNQMTASEKV